MQNRFFLFLILLVLNQAAHAFSIAIFPLAYEGRYVETQTKEYKVLSLTNYSMSLSHELHQILLEHTEINNRSGNTTLNFLEVSEELHLNYLYQVTRWSPYFSFYLGVGSGVYKSTVKTQYLNIESEENSGNTMFLSGLASLQFQYGYFQGQLDFRIIEAKDYSPQPQPGIIVRTGIRF